MRHESKYRWVLLGAWADVECAKQILDIGTGTGVIALMTAQKNKDAIIDAVDIDEGAFLQAKVNFEQSNWSKRLNAFHSSLQNFAPDKKYDAIISNPPYFIDDHKTGNQQKDIAKHSTELDYSELLFGINHLLTETGKTFLIIPVFNLEYLKLLAEGQNLFVTGLTEVIATDEKPPYVVLIRLERKVKEFLKNTIQIQNSSGNFTDEYKELTKEFYLKF